MQRIFLELEIIELQNGIFCQRVFRGIRLGNVFCVLSEVKIQFLVIVVICEIFIVFIKVMYEGREGQGLQQIRLVYIFWRENFFEGVSQVFLICFFKRVYLCFLQCCECFWFVFLKENICECVLIVLKCFQNLVNNCR